MSKKLLSVIALAMVIAIVSCITACSDSSNTNVKNTKEHAITEQYILYDSNKYNNWSKFKEEVIDKEKWHLASSNGEDPVGKTIELFAPIDEIYSGTNIKIGNCEQYGFIMLFGINAFRIPIVNKADAKELKEGDWVKIKGQIAEYNIPSGVDIVPKKDGSTLIEVG